MLYTQICEGRLDLRWWTSNVRIATDGQSHPSAARYPQRAPTLSEASRNTGIYATRQACSRNWKKWFAQYRPASSGKRQGEFSVGRALMLLVRAGLVRRAASVRSYVFEECTTARKYWYRGTKHKSSGWSWSGPGTLTTCSCEQTIACKELVASDHQSKRSTMHLELGRTKRGDHRWGRPKHYRTRAAAEVWLEALLAQQTSKARYDIVIKELPFTPLSTAFFQLPQSPIWRVLPLHVNM
jgi:hypothetical protein